MTVQWRGDKYQQEAGYAEGGSLCNKGVSVVLLQVVFLSESPSVCQQLALNYN